MYPRSILYTPLSHSVAVSVIRLTVVVSQFLCSGNPYLRCHKVLPEMPQSASFKWKGEFNTGWKKTNHAEVAKIYNKNESSKAEQECGHKICGSISNCTDRGQNYGIRSPRQNAASVIHMTTEGLQPLLKLVSFFVDLHYLFLFNFDGLETETTTSDYNVLSQDFDKKTFSYQRSPSIDIVLTWHPTNNIFTVWWSRITWSTWFFFWHIARKSLVA